MIDFVALAITPGTPGGAKQSRGVDKAVGSWVPKAIARGPKRRIEEGGRPTTELGRSEWRDVGLLPPHGRPSPRRLLPLDDWPQRGYLLWSWPTPELRDNSARRLTERPSTATTNTDLQRLIRRLLGPGQASLGWPARPRLGCLRSRSERRPRLRFLLPQSPQQSPGAREVRAFLLGLLGHPPARASLRSSQTLQSGSTDEPSRAALGARDDRSNHRATSSRNQASREKGEKQRPHRDRTIHLITSNY
jgi:hypothetical protein